MPDRRCCCVTGCYIGEDNFNRADNDDPGDQWHEVSGDWDILNNYLNGASEGILLTTLRQGVPVRTGNGYNIRMTVKLREFPASGTKSWGIICGYTDANNFDWIELNYDASTTNLYPKFYSRVAGVDSLQMDITTHPVGDPWGVYPGTESFHVHICYANVEWSIIPTGDDITQATVHWEMCGGGQASLPATYGMVGFLKGDFDDWYYEVHWESDSNCEYCTCFCLDPNNPDDYLCVPETLTLTITANTLYSCPEIDGMTLTMYQAYPDDTGDPSVDKSPMKYLWFSEKFTIETEEIWFILRCVSGRFELSVVPTTTLSPADAAGSLFFSTSPPYAKNMDQAASTCDPLELVFRDLMPDITTCDYGGGTGEKPRPCTTGDCWEPGEEMEVTWDVTITV